MADLPSSERLAETLIVITYPQPQREEKRRSLADGLIVRQSEGEVRADHYKAAISGSDISCTAARAIKHVMLILIRVSVVWARDWNYRK